MASTSTKIAGFDKQQWDLFLAPIPAALLERDPKSRKPYVKHQVCAEMLNRAFGVDGWRMEVVNCWSRDQYVDRYHLKDKSDPPQLVYEEDGTTPVFRDKLGRQYSEAQVRLTICAPGCDFPVVREDIGSMVSAADWSEARKGAVSEALKRAAARLGWASEVYNSEIIETTFRTEDWEPYVFPAYTAPWELPMNQAVALAEWMTELGWDEARQQSEMACVTSQATAANMGRELNWVLKTARPDAADLMRLLGLPEDEQALVLAKIVDVKSAQEIVGKLRAEASEVTDFAPPVASGTAKSLFGEATQ